MSKPRGAQYKVFHRTWWKRNKDWPEGLEPCAGRRYFVSWATTAEEAQDICRVWNANHEPGPLSDKAEYDFA